MKFSTILPLKKYNHPDKNKFYFIVYNHSFLCSISKMLIPSHGFKQGTTIPPTVTGFSQYLKVEQSISFGGTTP